MNRFLDTFWNHGNLSIRKIVSYYDLFFNYYFYGFHILSRYTGPWIPIFLPYLLFVAFVDSVDNELGLKITHMELEQKLHSITFLIPNLILLFYTLKILYIYSEEGYDRRLDNFIWGNYFILERSIKERLLEIKDEQAYGLTWSGYLSNKRNLPDPQEVFSPIFFANNTNEYSKDWISTMSTYKVLNYSERREILYSPYINIIDSVVETLLGVSFENCSKIIFDYAFHTGPNLDPDTLSIMLPSVREIHFKEISNMMVTNYIRRKLSINDENMVGRLYSYLERHDLRDLMRVEYQCDLLVELYGKGYWMEGRNELFSTLMESDTTIDEFLSNGFSHVDWISSLGEFWEDYSSIKTMLSNVIAKETLSILDFEVILIKSLLNRIQGCQGDNTRDDDWRQFFEEDIENTFGEFANEKNLFLLTDISKKFLYAKDIRLPTHYSFYNHYSIRNSSDFLSYRFDTPMRNNESLTLSLRGFNMTIGFYDWWYSQINMRSVSNMDDEIDTKDLNEKDNHCHAKTFNATNLSIFVPSQRSYLLTFHGNLMISIGTYQALKSSDSSLSESEPVSNYLQCVLKILELPRHEWVRFFLNGMDNDSIISIIDRLPWDLGALQETYKVYALCHDTKHILLNSVSKDEKTSTLVTYWVENTMFRYGNEMALALISIKEDISSINAYKVTEDEVREYADFYRSWLKDLKEQGKKILRGKFYKEQYGRDNDLSRSMIMFRKIFLAISLRQTLWQDLTQLIPFCRWARLRIETDPILDHQKFYKPLNTMREDEMMDYDRLYVSQKHLYRSKKGSDIELLLFKLIESQNNLLSQTSILTYLEEKHGELIIGDNQERLDNLDRDSKIILPEKNQEFLDFLNSHHYSIDLNPPRQWGLNDPNRSALWRVVNDSKVSEDSNQRIVYDAESDFTHSYGYVG